VCVWAMHSKSLFLLFLHRCCHPFLSRPLQNAFWLVCMYLPPFLLLLLLLLLSPPFIATKLTPANLLPPLPSFPFFSRSLLSTCRRRLHYFSANSRRAFSLDAAREKLYQSWKNDPGFPFARGRDAVVEYVDMIHPAADRFCFDNHITLSHHYETLASYTSSISSTEAHLKQYQSKPPSSPLPEARHVSPAQKGARLTCLNFYIEHGILPSPQEFQAVRYKNSNKPGEPSSARVTHDALPGEAKNGAWTDTV